MGQGTIVKVAGPLIVAEGMADSTMYDVVRVSDKKLVGEIIELRGDRASIQVYEETSGLGTGEPVESTGEPMSVELGPGLIGSIFDGIQRPLDDIMKISGNNLERGVEVSALKRDLIWHFEPTVQVGDKVLEGDVLGTVQETDTRCPTLTARSIRSSASSSSAAFSRSSTPAVKLIFSTARALSCRSTGNT